MDNRTMPLYRERTYRKRVNTRDLVSFHVVIKETDLWVSADLDLTKETRDLIFDCRHQIETYINFHPDFLSALLPWQEDPCAPPLVREMIKVTRDLGVGPMASVAGAIAQYVAGGLLNITRQVIVENGGDIYLKADRPMTVSIFAGRSPLSEKLGLSIPVRHMPLAVCTSSGTVGHSLSMGVADAVCLISPSATLADACATALGNGINGKGDLEKVAALARQVKGILGGVVIVDDRMATWGDIELIEL